jgi:hypothetical protein
MADALDACAAEYTQECMQRRQPRMDTLSAELAELRDEGKFRANLARDVAAMRLAHDTAFKICMAAKLDLFDQDTTMDTLCILVPVSKFERADMAGITSFLHYVGHCGRRLRGCCIDEAGDGKARWCHQVKIEKRQ